MLYDAHAHVHTIKKPAKVVEKFVNAGGKWIGNVLSDFSLVSTWMDLYKNFPNTIKPIVGVHPELVKSKEDADNAVKELESIVKEAKQKHVPIIAIGEIGLDTYWHPNTLKLQEKVLEEQLQMAKKMDLPVVFHIRAKEYKEYEKLALRALGIASKIVEEKTLLYFHSFVGTKSLARKLLNRGNIVLGINGIITYKSASSLREATEYIPLEKILIETDSPFLVPSNMPRDLLFQRDVNEPLAVLYTAKVIARIKGVELTKIFKQTLSVIP